MGRKACAGAGLAAACRAADRCRMASAAIARLGLSAVGPDAVGAVLMDGHIRRLRPACRALDGAAALYRDTPVRTGTVVPEALNDVTLYHNRGDSTFAGESSTYGDFVGLDDLWTERPEVVTGMTDIYSTWARSGVDGFRIEIVAIVGERMKMVTKRFNAVGMYVKF